MITCYLRYTIDPYQPAASERYSRLILLPDCGGRLRLIATISDPRVADRILAHRARAPGSPSAPA